MNTFHRILYTNDEIIKQKDAKWYLVLMVFISSIILIAAPFVSARLLTSPESLIEQFDGIENGLIKTFSEYDCEIQQFQLSCQQPFDSFTDNGYLFLVNVSDHQEVTVNNQYVMLSSSQVVVYNNQNHVQGGYEFLEGSSFNDLLKIKETQNITSRELAAHFLQNIYQSNIRTLIPQTYISIFVQYVIYVLLVSWVNMAINANKLKIKITFRQMLTMNVLAMFSLALFSGVIGLVSPVNATALFPLLYMARIVMLYFKLLRQ